MPHFRYKLQENSNEMRRSDSKERLNNKSASSVSFKSPQKNEISFNSKSNTIQIDNDAFNKHSKNSVYTKNKKMSIKIYNNAKLLQPSKNNISKSHSADSFYIAKSTNKNKAFRPKNSYSFNKNLLRDANSSQGINHYSVNLGRAASKNQNNNSVFNSTYKNQKSTIEEPNDEENVNLDGLFYNERFSHYKKDNKKFNKSSSDTIVYEKNNLSELTSNKNILNKDNSRILRNNQSTIDINNSLIMENPTESQVITSTKINVNPCRDFSRDSFEDKTKIPANNENPDSKFSNIENAYEGESLISPNISMLESNKQFGPIGYADNNTKTGYKDRMNNYNYRYDLYNEKADRILKDKRDYQTQIYRAYLKKDFFIDTLKLQFAKGQIIDVIFIGDGYHNQNEFLEKNYQENLFESQANNISSSKCYLIFDGNHYRIPREYIEIQKL